MSASTKRKTRQAEIEAGTYRKQAAQKERDEKKAKENRTMAICAAAVIVIVVAAILLNVIPAIKEKQELKRYTDGVAVTVKNVGSMDADEGAELYIDSAGLPGPHGVLQGKHPVADLGGGVGVGQEDDLAGASVLGGVVGGVGGSAGERKRIDKDQRRVGIDHVHPRPLAESARRALLQGVEPLRHHAILGEAPARHPAAGRDAERHCGREDV